MTASFLFHSAALLTAPVLLIFGMLFLILAFRATRDVLADRERQIPGQTALVFFLVGLICTLLALVIYVNR